MFFETDRCGLRGPSGRPELVTAAREEVLARGAAFAIRGYLDAGIDLLVEVGLWGQSTRATAANVFEPYDAWLIGLRWNLSELERRERRREDGIFPGTAARQAMPRDDWRLPYDVVVDTVTLSPEAAARELAEWLAKRPPPRAISAIASAPGGSGARSENTELSRPPSA